MLQSENQDKQQVLLDHLNDSVCAFEIRFFIFKMQNADAGLRWIEAEPCFRVNMSNEVDKFCYSGIYISLEGRVSGELFSHS